MPPRAIREPMRYRLSRTRPLRWSVGSCLSGAGSLARCTAPSGACRSVTATSCTRTGKDPDAPSYGRALISPIHDAPASRSAPSPGAPSWRLVPACAHDARRGGSVRTGRGVAGRAPGRRPARDLRGQGPHDDPRPRAGSRQTAGRRRPDGSPRLPPAGRGAGPGAGRAAAKPRDGAGPMVPAGFLGEDGLPVKGLAGLLTVLHDGGYDDREIVAWLYLDADLPGRPIDALRDNRGAEVKRRAQAMAL